MISKPFFKFALWAKSAAGGPAEFLSTSTGMLRLSDPRTIILIFFLEVIRALTVSEYLFKAKPNTSKPGPRFAVEQKALPTACVRTAFIARSRLIAEPETDKRGLLPLCRTVDTYKARLFVFKHYRGKHFRDA